MHIINNLWVEKYRPTSVEQMALAPDIAAALSGFITAREVPNLLMHGKPGTGKTSAARILINSIDCESIEINSSMDRGIQTVRDKIVGFAVMRGLKPWRVILLEEVDGMTPDAQQAARNLMEQYSHRVRFIMTCNYINRVIDPIKSRCQQLEFAEATRKACLTILRGVLDAEHIAYDVEVVMHLVELYYPDLRSIIQAAQLMVQASKDRHIAMGDTVPDTEDYNLVVDCIRSKKISDLWGIVYRLDYPRMFRYLFMNIDRIESDPIKQTEKRLAIDDHCYHDVMHPDREVNFMACILRLMQ